MDYEKLYIDGQWVYSNSGEFIEVENPANKEIIAKVPRGNEEDVNRAVASAKKGFETWKNISVEERINLVNKIAVKIKENSEEMSDIVTKELGSPRKFVNRTHVEGYLGRIESFIEIAKKYKYEEKLENVTIRKEPVGVVACLTPWNYPFGQIIMKIIPALLAGNTIVLKPSQNTPLIAYYLADIIDEIGFPKGVFNLVTGKGSEIGNILASHKDVDIISFTGSTTGGREVGKLAIDGVKKPILELGGKSAAILLKGGDYEYAINSTLKNVFFNTGQTCSARTRLIVPREDLSYIEELIKKESEKFIVGNPLDEKTQIGPLSSKKQFEKVKYYIELGIEEGANILVGEIPEENSEGYFVKPTVFTNVNNNMRISQEEIFGPVLVIIPYDTEKEAIEIANNSIYGLGGAVYGPDEKVKKIARKIDTGSIFVNRGKADVDAPFGGYKMSGIGREGGVAGFEEYLEIKSIYE